MLSFSSSQKKVLVIGLTVIFASLIILHVRFALMTNEDKFRYEFENRRQVTFENFQDIYEKYKDALTLSQLLSIIDEDPYCHSEGHDLGKLIHTQTGSIEESFSICKDRCSDGCYHGVLMAAFDDVVKDSGDGHTHIHVNSTQLAPYIKEVCAKDYIGEGFNPTHCAHGVGHALTFISFYDLNDATDLCLLFEDARHEYYCLTGVFMEFTTRFPVANLHSPCDQLPDEYAVACYRYRVSGMLNTLGSVEPVAAECQTLSGRRRLGCFHGLGYAKTSQIANDPKSLARTCSYGNQTERKMCIDGPLGWLSEQNEKISREACAYFEEKDLREYCLDLVQQKKYPLERPDFDLFYPI